MKKIAFFVIAFIAVLAFSCSKGDNSDQNRKTGLDKKTTSYTAGEIHNLVMDDFLANRQQILNNAACATPGQACNDYFELLAAGYLPNYVNGSSTQSVLDFYNSSNWAYVSSLGGSALIAEFANTFSPEAATVVEDALDLINVSTSYSVIYNGLDNLELDAQNLPSTEEEEIVLAILDVTRHSAIHWENNNGGPGSWRPTMQHKSYLDPSGDPGTTVMNADAEGAIQGATAGFINGLESGGIAEAISQAWRGATFGATLTSSLAAFWGLGYIF